MLDLHLETIKCDQLQSLSLTKKDNDKIEKYFNSFDYLNNDSLVLSHLQKIRHVGIDSLKQGSLFIQQVSDYIINQVNTDLTDITTSSVKLKELMTKFENKDKFFTKKVNIFEIYQENKSKIESLCNHFKDLQLKLEQHSEHLSQYESVYNDAIYLLERDVYLLSKFMTFISDKESLKKHVLSFAKELELISKNITYQKQLVLQKYQFLMTIKENVSHYTQNIQYVINVTMHMLTSMVELEILNKLPKSNIHANLDKAQEMLSRIQNELSKMNATV